MKELNKLAKNSESIKDQLVYRGFVDENADPDVEYDYSEDTLVKISPIGKFVGSSPDGKPTVEIIDENSILQMAKQTEELLLDKDHASMRGPEDRNTEAYGWISGLKAIIGLGDMDGLYGLIKWTSKGIDLAKDRIYRFLSPVFELDAEGRAMKLVNVALTNRPALPLPPIINSEAEDKSKISITESKKDTDGMNKDEINAMVIEMVKKALAENSKAEETKEVINSEAEKVEETKEETKEEVKNEDVHIDIIEEKKDDVKVEEVKNAKETADETKKEDTKEESKEETKEEVKEEEKKEEEKEVIKAETLNSAAVTVGTSINGMDAWRNLKGEEFFKYLRAHPEIK